MKYQLELEWRMDIDSRWHIGSGLGGGLVDRTVVRDHKRRPFIPGATLKGIVRDCCERIAASLGFEKIKDPNERQGIENFVPAGVSDYIVDRLFGSRFSGENVFFRNVLAAVDQSVATGMVITRNQRDRLSGTARPRHLYSTEEILPTGDDSAVRLEKVCVSAVHDVDTLTPAQDKKGQVVIAGERLAWPLEYSLLLAGIFATERMGSSKSRGLGHFKVDRASVSILLNGHKVSASVAELVGLLANASELTQLREGEQSLEDVLQLMGWRTSAPATAEPPLTPLVVSNPDIHEVEFVAKPISGVSISCNRASHMAEVLDYIPGSTLRGALAKLYLKNYGQDQAFAGFVSAPNSFGDLLPSSDEKKTGVIPNTAMSCKRQAGFDGHGVSDHLFLQAACYLVKDKGMPLRREQLEAFAHCPVCDNMLKEYSGYVHPDKADKALYMHVGIDRLTRTSSPEILYGIEAVHPTTQAGKRPDSDGKPLSFVGTAWLEASFYKRLEALQQSGQHIFVGHSKTRGYGELKWHMAMRGNKPQSGAVPEEFGRHLQNFSSHFHDFCREKFDLKLPDDRFYFALGMESHTIIVDPWLRYTCEAKAVLDSLALTGCEPVWSKASLVQIRGWQQKHGLPKEDEFAIQRGSVYLFSTPSVSETISRLWQIANSGVGLRGEEGFGRLTVSSGFHFDYQVGGKL